MRDTAQVSQLLLAGIVYVMFTLLSPKEVLPTWRLHTKLYYFRRTFRRISEIWDNARTSNSLFSVYNTTIAWLYLLHGFCLFVWFFLLRDNANVRDAERDRPNHRTEQWGLIFLYFFLIFIHRWYQTRRIDIRAQSYFQNNAWLIPSYSLMSLISGFVGFRCSILDAGRFIPPYPSLKKTANDRSK